MHVAAFTRYTTVELYFYVLYVLCALISALTPLITAIILSANVTNSHVTQYAEIKRQVYNNYYVHNPTSPLYNPCAKGGVMNLKPTYTFTVTQSFLRGVDAERCEQTLGSTVKTKFFTLHHQAYLVQDKLKGSDDRREHITCTATFNSDKNPVQDTRIKQTSPAQEEMHSHVPQLHDRHYVHTIKLQLGRNKLGVGKQLRKRKILVMDSVKSERH